MGHSHHYPVEPVLHVQYIGYPFHNLMFSLCFPVTLSPPAIEWSHATGMLTPLLQCLGVWVEQTTTGATQVHTGAPIITPSICCYTSMSCMIIVLISQLDIYTCTCIVSIYM